VAAVVETPQLLLPLALSRAFASIGKRKENARNQHVNIRTQRIRKVVERKKLLATVKNVAVVLVKGKVKENEVRPRVASLVGDRIRLEEKEKEKENREAKAPVQVERVLRLRLGSLVFILPEAIVSLGRCPRDWCQCCESRQQGE
jgi:hypothetical protein